MVCYVVVQHGKMLLAVFATEGEEAGRAWLANQGRKNIEDLNVVLGETATPWLERAEVK